MMGQVVRWATPFEDESERRSVATASCCCCCCCCLASTAVLAAHAARSTFDEARRNERSGAAPLLLGVLTIPLGVFVPWLIFDSLSWPALAAGLIVGLGILEVAGQLAGSRPFRFGLRGLMALLFWVFASILELQAVLMVLVLAANRVRYELLLGIWAVVAAGAALMVLAVMGSVDHEQ